MTYDVEISPSVQNAHSYSSSSAPFFLYLPVCRISYWIPTMLFGNRNVDLGKSTDPDDDLYEDFNYR